MTTRLERATEFVRMNPAFTSSKWRLKAEQIVAFTDSENAELQAGLDRLRGFVRSLMSYSDEAGTVGIMDGSRFKIITENKGTVSYGSNALEAIESLWRKQDEGKENGK